MEHRIVTLHPDVALRPEPFGALAYHYGNRRLVFLRHPDLVAVVHALDGHRTITEVLDAEGIAPRRRASFITALASLLDSEMLCKRAPRANHRDGAPLRSSGAVIGAPPVVPAVRPHDHDAPMSEPRERTIMTVPRPPSLPFDHTTMMHQ